MRCTFSIQHSVASWLFLMLVSTVSWATDQGRTLVADDFWIRLVPPVSTVSAAFGTITSKQDRVLVKASSSRSDVVEIHANITVDGTMHMRQLDSLELPAETPVELVPGGYHLMFIGLKSALKQGDMVDLLLKFSSGETLMIDVPVVKGGAPMRHSDSHQ